MRVLADAAHLQLLVAAQKLTDGATWLGQLSYADASLATREQARVMVACYMDHRSLRALAEGNGRAVSDLIANDILPDNPSVKSGDFGEMLAVSILRGWRDRPKFPVLRWRARAHKNDTVRGTDLLGFVWKRATPDPNDLLVLCEVKTRSATVSTTVVADAYAGVTKDYVTRLGNQLLFAQYKLRTQGQPAIAGRIARFRDPHAAPYKRRLVACVMHAKDTWDPTFLDTLPEQHRLDDEVLAVVICVERLAEWIDDVRAAASS